MTVTQHTIANSRRAALMRLLQSAVLAITGALLAAAAIAAPPQEIVCPSDNPRDTQVWRNFQAFISQEYARGARLNSLDLDDQALVLGHALGRVALAMHDDVTNQQAVACLQRGIDIYFTTIPGPGYRPENDPGRRLYRLARDTALGWNDDLVKRRTGVADRQPAYSVLGLSGPPAGPGPAARVVPGPVDSTPPPNVNLARGDGRFELEFHEADRDRCAQKCSESSDYLTFCYYWTETKTCRITTHAAPALSMSGRYGIFSTRLNAWLTRESLDRLDGPNNGARRPGYYVFKTVGNGWRKGSNGVAIKIVGYRKSVIKFDDAVSQPKLETFHWTVPTGYDVDQLFSKWRKQAAKTSADNCAQGPLWCGGGACKPEPDIWVEGPQYSIESGPHKSLQDAHVACGDPYKGNLVAGSNKQWRHDRNHQLREVDQDCQRLGG